MNGVWIRSQYKGLYLIKGIYPPSKMTEFGSKERPWEIIGCCLSKHVPYLGGYATEERALEVLDEIQAHIEEARRESLMAAMGEKGTYDVIAWGNTVFEMPEE